jgi:hypothetical protein
MKSKYKVSDILFHKEQKVFLFVDAVDFVKNQNLYTLKVMNPTSNKGSNDEWKRYYESKLEDKCAIITRKDVAEVLYGKSV